MKHIGTQFVDGFSLALRSLIFLFKNPLFLIGSITLLLIPTGVSAALQVLLISTRSLSNYSEFVVALINLFLSFIAIFIIASGVDNKLHHRPYTFLPHLKLALKKIVPIIVVALIWGVIALIWGVIILRFSAAFLKKESTILNGLVITILLTHASLFNANIIHTNKILEIIKRSLYLRYHNLWQFVGGTIGTCLITIIPSLALFKIMEFIRKMVQAYLMTNNQYKSIPTMIFWALQATFFVVTTWIIIALCTITVFGVMFYQHSAQKRS